MVKKICVFVLISTFLNASLQSLQRTTPSETNFDTGLSTSWNAGDDDSIQVNIGFNFPFNGTSYSQIYINSNGMLSFESNKKSGTYNNKHLSDTNEPPDKFQIFPYWDDIRRNSGQTIKYATLDNNGANERFVVEWKNVAHYNNSNKHYTFQVVLYTDGSIRFRYDANSDADGTSCNGNNSGATIGVRENASHYDEYSYDAAINQTKDVLYSPIPPPTDNDYADFHFDELFYDGTNGEIRDSHWDKHGKGHNVSVVEGKLCNAIDLSVSSSSDYAVLGEGALDGVTDFTIAVWHKGSNGNDSNALISAANSSEDNEILFWMNNATTFIGHLKNKQENISTTNINDGSWHHLAWRVKNKKSCFFFDGQKKGCKDYSYAPSTFSVEGLILGQDQDSVGGGFDSNQDWEGVLDELLIFRKALTDSEIQTGYNNQNAGKNWNGTIRTCPYPTIKKTSCVIKDPVEGTTKPKRIPGATIRYAIEVNNPNTSKTDNNKVTDDVDDILFDIASIKNLKIGNSSCDCLNPGSTNANGSGGTSNGEDPVKLDFGTINGKSKKCGYFEVEIK